MQERNANPGKSNNGKHQANFLPQVTSTVVHIYTVCRVNDIHVNALLALLGLMHTVHMHVCALIQTGSSRFRHCEKK